jgi:hypothetical protein
MKKFLETQSSLWKEFVEDSKSIDLDNFELNDELNPEIWMSENKIRPEVAVKLVEIAKDFLKNIGLEDIDYEDITFTGSLANFNWSKYSDVDLNVLINFSDFDENVDLVREFFRAKSGLWNKDHDLRIRGFEVEIYGQDSEEPHISTGVYSLLKNEWLVKPTKEPTDINYRCVENKAERLMDMIDQAGEIFYKEEYKESHRFGRKIKEKIKKFRKCGLERGGQFSEENIAFKILRRNGYLEKLSNIVTNSYDRLMSLSDNYQKKFDNFIKEEEPFQDAVKAKHTAGKKRLIGLGDNNNEDPYSEKPNFKRSKSAPPQG